MALKNGRNPTRRNRNIGTSKQGHGKDNRMVIPDRFSAYDPYELDFDSAILVQGELEHPGLRIYIEPVSQGFAHCCTPSEIVAVVAALPHEFTTRLHVVLHQPTHKRQTLRPVWGRMLYLAGIRGHDAPTIMISAQKPEEPLRWSKKLGPRDMEELERLREDGHRVTLTRRHWEIQPSAESIRNTQLLRTLPHEIGHLADFQTFTCGDRQPEYIEEDDDFDRYLRLSDLYSSRPACEREEFAHRFAETYRTSVEVALALDPSLHGPDPLILRTEGVEPRWFAKTRS